MPVTKSRYRPAFSKEEVDVLDTILRDRYLIESGLSNTTTYLCPADKAIYTQLFAKISTLKSKIANDAIAPAYLTTKNPDHKIAKLESLGASEDEVANASGTETKEQYWTRCYNKCMDDIDHCTVADIKGYQEYKYLHDLMSPEEVAAHERDSN